MNEAQDVLLKAHQEIRKVAETLRTINIPDPDFQHLVSQLVSAAEKAAELVEETAVHNQIIRDFRQKLQPPNAKLRQGSASDGE